jgi:hypothetical protein
MTEETPVSHRMFERSFNATEREFLSQQPRFCNAAATIETLADVEKLVELGVQLVAERDRPSSKAPPSMHTPRTQI